MVGFREENFDSIIWKKRKSEIKYGEINEANLKR